MSSARLPCATVGPTPWPSPSDRCGSRSGWPRDQHESHTHRLLFLTCLAHALLTLLGAASEAIGYDRILKANTVKTRTHSLLRQGTLWFQMIPNYPAEKLAPLLAAFEREVKRHEVLRRLLGVL